MWWDNTLILLSEQNMIFSKIIIKYRHFFIFYPMNRILSSYLVFLKKEITSLINRVHIADTPSIIVHSIEFNECNSNILLNWGIYIATNNKLIDNIIAPTSGLLIVSVFFNRFLSIEE